MEKTVLTQKQLPIEVESEPLEVKPEPATAKPGVEKKNVYKTYKPGKVVDDMFIRLTPEVLLQLETIGSQTRGVEFSGLGWVTPIEDGILCDKIKLMHVGSETFTEIPSQDIMRLWEDEESNRIRLWFHRHPMGSNIPGPGNWSGIDNTTIRETPLGGIPELVKWSASIVRTPRGWVGRIDRYDIEDDYTVHVGVAPNVDLQLIQTADELYRARWSGWGAYNDFSFTDGLGSTGLLSRLSDIEKLSTQQWSNLMDLADADLYGELWNESPIGDLRQHAFVPAQPADSSREYLNELLNEATKDMFELGEYNKAMAIEIAANALWDADERRLEFFVEEVMGAGSYKA